MKKIAVIILSSLIMSLTFGVPTIFADNHTTATEDERPDLKVYYSEPIGAGQKVYHITACQKTQAYAPLRCNAQNTQASTSAITAQCKPNGKLSEGTVVKGCLASPSEDTQPQNRAMPLYPDVNIDEYNANKCNDDPLRQSYYYVPEYAIVETRDLSKPDKPEIPEESKWIIQKTLAWDTDDPSSIPQAEVIDKLYTQGKAKILMRPTLCTTFDVIAEGDNAGPEAPGTEMSGALMYLYSAAKDGSQSLIDAGCDNDNSRGPIGSIQQSTPFNPFTSYSCSTRWRITGKTGSDIFGQYISGIYKWAAGLVGLIVVLTMVYSGIQISVAGGNTALVDEAKNRIMKSIIGLVILFLSGLILYTINPSFFTG